MKWNRSPSKKLLRIRVTSHESELEFNISPKSTGKYLFDLVCSTIGLRETWYFGLQSYSLLPNGRMRLSQWLKLDKKIVSQKSNAGQKQLCFYFHPKFFPEDIEQELIQATTRHLFYLSVKATILNRQETHVNGSTQGDLCPNVDVAILLASLAAQAEYGDLCEDDLDGKDDPNFLPNRLLRLIPRQLIPVIQSDQALAQKLRECYKSYKGINRDRAELQYLKVAQMHHLFGVDYFPIVCVRMKYPRTITLSRYLTRSQLTPWHVWDKHHTNAWLGVTAAGIQLYGRNRQEQPRYTFQWNIIKNVSYRERKFTIKLIANWRCCNKSSMTPSSITAGASSHPVTSMESGTVPQPVSQRPRQSNRSAVGRTPLLSSTGPLLLADVPLGSTACGSGASAASLPSTPLSVRLTLRPTASSSAGSAAAASGTTLASSRVAQESIYERAGPQITHSSTVTKTGRIFDFELGCVPSLTPISSRCSAGELPLLGAGSCLIAQHTSTNDSSGAASSTSSRSSFVHLHRPTTNSVVSVVEVWLADPTQAKTVMSMCAGNHALFMRRRQPDSVEVQQMRAQAREERARREIERSRLARARAEKAEALEAKWALESRCAQLEQALRRHQSLKLAYLSPEWLAPDGRRPMLRHLPDESETEPPMRKTYQHLNSSTAHMFSSNRSDDGVRLSFTAPGNDEDEPEQAENELSSIHRKVSTDNVDTEHSDIRFNESTFYPTEELSESKVLNSEDRLWNEMHPRRFPRHSSGFHDHSRGIPDRPYAGSSSTPATPHSKRDGSRHDPQSGVHPTHTPRAPPRSQSHQGHSHTRHTDPATSVAHSRLHCSACMYAKSQSFPGSDFFHACFPPVCDDGAPFHPPEPCPVCRHIPEHRHAMGFKTPYPRHFHPIIPGSLPALHQPYGVYDDAAWHPAVHPCGGQLDWLSSPTCKLSTPHVANTPFYSIAQTPAAVDPLFRHPDSWYSQNALRYPSGMRPQCNRQHMSSSLSAILSPTACHRWHHSHPKKEVPFVNYGLQPYRLDGPQHVCCRSAPFLAGAASQDGLMQYDWNHFSFPGDCSNQAVYDWPQLSDSAYRGYSLQHLSDPSGIWGPYSDEYHPTPSYPNPFNDYAIRRVPSGGSAWAGEAPILPAPSVPTYFDGFLASDPLCSPQPPIPLGLSHRGCISRRLQEERARFAILQAQFSKQLRDTWACLRVTRSAGRLKPNEPYSPLFHSSATTNELRLDPAGASDGASTGGCGGVPGPTGLAAVGVDGPSPTHVGGLHESTHPAMQHPVQLEHTGWDHPECAVGRVPVNAPFGVQNPYYEPTDLSTGRFCPNAAAFTGAQVPGVAGCWCPTNLAIPCDASITHFRDCGHHFCQLHVPPDVSSRLITNPPT